MLIRSETELATRKRELHNAVANLEADHPPPVRRGIYITKGTWQSDISQIAVRLRKDGQAGWLYFVEENRPDS